MQICPRIIGGHGTQQCLGQAKIVSRGDFDIHRPARVNANRLPKSFNNGRFVSETGQVISGCKCLLQKSFPEYVVVLIG